MKGFLKPKEQSHLTCSLTDKVHEYLVVGLFYLQLVLVVGYQRDQGI